MLTTAKLADGEPLLLGRLRAATSEPRREQPTIVVEAYCQACRSWHSAPWPMGNGPDHMARVARIPTPCQLGPFLGQVSTIALALDFNPASVAEHRAAIQAHEAAVHRWRSTGLRPNTHTPAVRIDEGSSAGELPPGGKTTRPAKIPSVPSGVKSSRTRRKPVESARTAKTVESLADRDVVPFLVGHLRLGRAGSGRDRKPTLDLAVWCPFCRYPHLFDHPDAMDNLDATRMVEAPCEVGARAGGRLIEIGVDPTPEARARSAKIMAEHAARLRRHEVERRIAGPAPLLFATVPTHQTPRVSR